MCGAVVLESDYASLAGLSLQDMGVWKQEPGERIHIFISYAQQDQYLCDQLENHLSDLKYRGLITTWNARKIGIGEEGIEQIHMHLRMAHIILLLISANFLASEHCYSQEMMQALQRHKYGEASVIPVLLRPVVFAHTPFAQLHPLPTNRKPVVNWRNRDRAFVDIALGIERVVLKCLASGLSRGQRGVQGYPEISLDPILSQGWWRSSQRRREEEETRLRALDEAGRRELEQDYYMEALVAYEQALRQNDTDATAYQGKGNMLARLERYDEAVLAFEQSVVLAPIPVTYVSLGDVLTILGRYDEAVVAYEQAIALDALYVSAYTGMNEVLLLLGRTQETKQLEDADLDAVASLKNLAQLYHEQRKYAEVEMLYWQILSVYEQRLGEMHPNTALSLHNLAGFYDERGRGREAEPLFKRALLIREQALGETHPDTQSTRRWYVSLLRKMGRDEEADSVEAGGSSASEDNPPE